MHPALGEPLRAVAIPPIQAIGPSAIDGVPPRYRAAASFALVLGFGAAVLFRSQRYVEDAVDSSMASPTVSVVYGLIAYGLVAFLGLLGLTQLSLVGITSSSVAYAAAGLIAIGMLGLAGLGYTVVGTRLVEPLNGREPWNGLVIGAVVSAGIWLVLPSLTAALLWVLLAAVGVGGPVRTWMHDERGVGTETEV